MLGDELGGRAPIAGGDRVADGLRDLPLVGEPRGRAPVQRRRGARLLGLQARAQQLGEQVVVAVPLTAAVERDDEQVAAVEVREPRGRAVAAHHGVAQGAGHPPQDRGLQQEAALLRLDPVEHLGRQVVADLLAVARQGADQLLARVGAQREARELQAGGPPLGALLDLGHALGRELEAQGGEVGPRLGLAEAQLAAAQLDELVARPQAREHRPRWVGARRHGEVQGGGQALDERHERAVDRLVGDGVQVVEHEHDALGQLDELVDEQRDDDVLEARAVRAQRPLGAPADARHDHPQRLDHAGPEAHGIVVAGLQRQPRERLVGRREAPLLQQRRLARASGGREHRQARVPGAGQERDEGAARDEPLAARGHLELGRGDDAHVAVSPPSTVHSAPVT